MNYLFNYDKTEVKLDYTGNIEDVGIILNNKIFNYVGIMHEMKEAGHMKYISLQNVGYMKYTINSNHYHFHIKSKINENNLIEKKLIITNNVSFKMTKCGCEGYFGEEIEEN